MISATGIDENFIRDRYKLFKQRAMAELSRFSDANGWTDFGLHDTGVVILEQLCRQIIELEMRAGTFIADILAHESKPGIDVKRLALTAEEILPSIARSRADLFKLILDCPGVRNARVLISTLDNEIKGGYRVYVLAEDGCTRTRGEADDFMERILKRLYEHRNLCEDFFEVKLIERKKFHIKADLEIDESVPKETAAAIVSQVLFDLQNFFTPSINFYSLSEMLEQRGYSVEEVYSGPLLECGFIDDRDLATNFIKNQLHTYEVVGQIGLGKNIRSVLRLSVYLNGEQVPIAFEKISDLEAFELDVERSSVTLYQNGNPIYASLERINQLYKNLNEARRLSKSLCPKEEISYNKGEYREIFEYKSLQNDFPLVYGLGIEGPRYGGSDHLKKNTYNLKGYLLLFDQMLTNAVARLANAKVFFSMRLVEEKDFAVQLPGGVPYFEKLLKPITPHSSPRDLDAEEFCAQRSLLGLDVENASEKNLFENKIQGCLQHLKSIVHLQDLNAEHVSRVLDFILSLLGEKFYDDFLRIGLTSDEALTKKLVNAKREVLEDFYTKKLEGSFNFFKQKESHKRNSVSWLEQRIKGLLAIEGKDHGSGLCEAAKGGFKSFLAKETKWPGRRHAEEVLEDADEALQFEGRFPRMQHLILKHGAELANYEVGHDDASGRYTVSLFFDRERDKKVSIKRGRDMTSIEEAEGVIMQAIAFAKKVNKASEGLYLVEHILLRPGVLLKNPMRADDPYSFRLTAVLPSWPNRFQRKEFRDALYKLIVENSPAHLLVNVLWLDFDEMETFERLHRQWLELKVSREAERDALEVASRNLLGLLLMYGSDHV